MPFDDSIDHRGGGDPPFDEFDFTLLADCPKGSVVWRRVSGTTGIEFTTPVDWIKGTTLHVCIINDRCSVVGPAPNGYSVIAPGRVERL